MQQECKFNMKLISLECSFYSRPASIVLAYCRPIHQILRNKVYTVCLWFLMCMCIYIKRVKQLSAPIIRTLTLRINTYLIGILLGYLLYRTNGKLRIPRVRHIISAYCSLILYYYGHDVIFLASSQETKICVQFHMHKKYQACIACTYQCCIYVYACTYVGPIYLYQRVYIRTCMCARVYMGTYICVWIFCNAFK